MKKKIKALIALILMACSVLAGCGHASLSSVAAVTESAVTQAVSDEKATDAYEKDLTETVVSHEETSGQAETDIHDTEEDESYGFIDESGTYTSKDEVALFIHLYGHLPDNYITKSEAEDLGWVNSKGNLADVAPGKSIGGDKFGNREGLLPEKPGRKYYECDIDYVSGMRNAKRIIFSNDGLVYYTEDHYESFEKLYGEE